jgi:HAD superfamily hydrolase (TIGR01509 family)
VLQAVVFDFDGLIVDTEWPEYRSIADCFEDHGQHFPPEAWVHVIGSSWDVDWVAELEGLVGRTLDRAALHTRRRDRARELREPLVPMPGVVELLTAISDAGLALAVASSSPRDWVEPLLERLGLRAPFRVVCCRDDVSEAKPSPELYVLACAALGVEPARTVALEDSANGITAANAAGLRSVAVPNRLTAYLDLSHADLRVGSLHDLDLRALRALVEAADGSTAVATTPDETRGVGTTIGP